MAQPQQDTVKWGGASHKQYTYHVYALPHSFQEGQDGNYIFSKLHGGVWVPIYIGQGDLGRRIDDENHHKAACIKSRGATHIHAHLNRDKDARLAEERDLLDGHPEAYVPTGCNEA